MERAVETVESIPEATEEHAVQSAKQILATIRTKSTSIKSTFMLFIAYLPYFAAIKKVDPKYLLQVSKELAGLMSAMVSKTRDELVKDEVMLFSFLSNFSF